MAILSTQEDVPSSGINVNEYINQGDLTPLPSLGGQGISPQFMFSPDPNGGGGDPNGGSGNPGNQAVQVQQAGGQQVMVTVDENNRPIRVLEGGMVMTSAGAGTVVTSMGTVAVSNMQHSHQHHHMQSAQPGQATLQQQHILVTHTSTGQQGGGPGSTTGSATPGVDEQPQDLTPAQEQNNSLHNNSGSNTPTAMQQQQQSMLTSTPVSQAGGGGVGTPGGSASNSPTTPTSAAAMAAAAAAAAQHKKDRNSRKNCTYCHKVHIVTSSILHRVSLKYFNQPESLLYFT